MEPEINKQVSEFTSAVRGEEASLASFVWHLFSARNMAAPREDIEDVIGDGYVQAISLIRSKPELVVRNPVAWFRRVLFFVAMRHIARKIKDKSMVAEIDKLESEALAVEAVSNASAPTNVELQILVAQLLGLLEPRDREIMEKYYADGFTSKEIASELGMSAEAVRKSKSRAVRLLGEVFMK